MSSESDSVVIRAHQLGKHYRLGNALPHDTIRDALAARWSRWTGRQPLPGGDSAKSFWALRDASFEITAGETVGIVGRNGAGKSTLLKILSRVTRPSAGWLEAFGRVGSLLEVGTGFHPELTGRENIFLSGAILGMKRAEIRSKFERIADFAEIGRFLDTPVKRYSSGMFVRLGFAVAAHLEPEILVVDEVLSVGDAAFQQKCFSRMQQITASGCTILFVSHNLNSVRRLCQRAIWLEQGAVVADAAADTVVQQYLRSLEHAAQLPLRNRTVRGGSGEARIVAITIDDPEHQAANVLRIGRPARFSFTAEGQRADLACSFTLYDPFGQPVTYFDSAVVAESDGTAETDQFVCLVDELLLLPGTYRLNAALTRRGQLVDHVEGAATFQVEPADLRGRRVLSQGAYGSVQMPHQWWHPRVRRPRR